MSKGWEVKKLGEVLSFSGGGTPDKTNKKYWNGEFLGHQLKMSRKSISSKPRIKYLKRV